MVDCTLAYPPQGKRVVIIGAGKSAHDVGLVTSKVRGQKHCQAA